MKDLNTYIPINMEGSLKLRRSSAGYLWSLFSSAPSYDFTCFQRSFAVGAFSYRSNQDFDGTKPDVERPDSHKSA